MDAGERIMIEYAWTQLLAKQQAERDKLKDIHEKQREEFYRDTKAHWDTRERVK